MDRAAAASHKVRQLESAPQCTPPLHLNCCLMVLLLQGVAGIVKDRIAKAALGLSGGQRPMLLFPEACLTLLQPQSLGLLCGQAAVCMIL